MRTMLQIVIDKTLLSELKKYAKENGLKYSDVVRQLIHTEVYHRQSLAKPIDPKLPKGRNRA